MLSKHGTIECVFTLSKMRSVRRKKSSSPDVPLEKEKGRLKKKKKPCEDANQAYSEKP